MNVVLVGLDDRFQMQSSKKIRKELDEMCNLSYIILEEGMEKGIYEKKKQVVCEMLLDHQPYDLIKKYAGATEEEIKQVEEELLAVKLNRIVHYWERLLMYCGVSMRMLEAYLFIQQL